jgi:uncharacterized protein
LQLDLNDPELSRLKRPVESFRYRFFRALAGLGLKRPYLVLLLAFALAAASVLYTKARLQFRTGQDDLISTDNPDSRNYLRYTKEFPDLDGLIIVVRATPDPQRAERFADALAKRLLADRANVKSVFYRVDPGLFSNRALLYLDRDELKTLASRVEEHRRLLAGYAASPSLANFFKIVNRETDRAMAAQMRLRPGPRVAGVGAVPGGRAGGAMDTAIVDSVLNGMLGPEAAAKDSPWSSLAAVDGQSGAIRAGYLASGNGKYLLLNVAPGDGTVNGPDPVEAIEADLKDVRAHFPGIEAGMTGGPALAYAEESTTAHDIALASVIAIATNVLLLVIPFRGLVGPAFAIMALLVGVSWSFGFTTLAVGHLNLLSAVFTSILAGIGINFPVHLMARYEEARRSGLPVDEAVELSVVNTGTGVVASACIMALAFLMPIFTDFKGIAELGLVSAAGLFLCLVSALLVFPAMVVLRERYRPAKRFARRKTPAAASGLGKLFSKPGLIVGLFVAATISALFLVPRVKFDQNLLKLQAENTEAVKYENILLKDSGRSSWFAVALAPTREAAERKAVAFRKLPEVASVETIATYIPKSQEQKLATLAQLKSVLGPIDVGKPDPPSEPRVLMRELAELHAKLAVAASADPSGRLAHTAVLLKRAMTRLGSGARAFADYERRMAADFDSRLSVLKDGLSPGKVTEANLPAVLRQRFIGVQGSYLVQIHPRGDIWQDAPLHRFVTALRTVDPKVTGPPVQTYAIATVMRHGYERAAVLALIAVFVFVFIDFRNFRDTALATIPLVFGGAWLLEAMGLLGWEFNLANLFAVPIIIGTAVDNGVNMLYRWREERDKSAPILTKAVGKSVTICSLTTIAGFAALISANHRGISSLGWVLSVGVTLILVATLVVLPALFELFGRRLKDAPQMAADNPPLKAAGGQRG